MKPRFIPTLLALTLFALLLYQGPASSQAPDSIMVAAKKAAADLLAAEKTLTSARNALENAKNNLDTNLFNSPAYNARITADQVKAAKDRMDKAGPKEKEDAQEKWELSDELAKQRKAELDAAEKLLPQREAAAKAAEEKYAVVFPAAEKMAGQIKELFRQTENTALDRLIAAKLATEKAAFAKAKADQRAEANAKVVKALEELDANLKTLQAAAAAWQKAPEKERAKKLAELEKTSKSFAAIVQTAGQHLPAVQQLQVFKVTGALVEADKSVQKSAAALQQIKQDVQNKINAVKARLNEVQAAQKKYDATKGIRARKDLKFFKESAGRAEAARAEAEKLLPPRLAEAEKAQKGYAAALQTALQVLLQSPSAEKTLAATRAVINKGMAEKNAEIKTENATLAREAAEAQKGMDQANAERATADRLVAEQRTVRASLEKSLRVRFYRDVTRAGEEVAKAQGAVSGVKKTLQAKLAAFNTAEAAVQKAKENGANARKTADAQAAVVTSITKEHAAAKQLAQATAAVAQQAKAAVTAAQEAVKKASGPEAAKAKAAAKTALENAKVAQAKAAAAKTALDNLNTKFQAADKAAKTAAAAAGAAEQKATAARAALEKATAEKTTAEQAANQQEQTLGAALTKLAAAKAASQGGLKPLSQSAWDYAKARHLMVRAGFGGTADEVARLHSMGLYRAVDHLVNFHKLPPADIAFVPNPKERPEEYEKGLSGQQRENLRQLRLQKEAQQIQNMRLWWMRRMIETPRPLEEKLTLFWHNHFATQYSTVADSYHMYLQNQLFRDNAAGNFANLLHGITHDAAMLNYLNNDTNVKGRPNENLAREIMELFSMGRDQGYSEIDIRQGARALTGYTYDPWTGQFRFIKTRHEPEEKTIFGRKGDWAGDDFAMLILETPYPPKFIARQLFKWFVHDEPSIDTIESLANILAINNYELGPMLENLFLSEEFYSAKAMGSQIKSPIQLVVGLHRDLGLKDPNLPYLIGATNNMGQLVFEPPSVFGWPAGRAWVNSTRVFSRYNALADIVEGVPRAGKTGVDVVGTLLAGKQFQTHAEVVDYLVRTCMSVPLPETKRQALIEFLRPLPPPAEWSKQVGAVNARLTRMLAILICSPEYQLS